MKDKRRLLLIGTFIAVAMAWSLHQPVVRAAAQKIVGGPYVVGATSQSATIVWIVESGQVALKPAGGDSAKWSPAFQVESTTMTDLKPNTAYEYDVASGDAAGQGFFKTPPFGPTAPYRFVVYGDNRTRPEMHRRVIDEVLKHGFPDFVVQTGDMVANGDDSAQWPVFFEIERELLRHTVFFPTLGNHERNTSYFQQFFKARGQYYSFDWGTSHFSVLNSDIVNAAISAPARQAAWEEQVRWLEYDLQTHQEAAFRFVVSHHPPFTAVDRRQDDNQHVKAIVPLLEKYHVAAGFFGHDHNYQHYLRNGLHFITTGGGGAPLYDVNRPPAGITQKVASIENFVSVSVDGKKAHVQAIALDGSIVDEFDIDSPRN